MSLILLLPLIIAAAYALTLPRLPTIKNVSGVAAAGKANIEGSGELGNIDVNFTGIVGAGTVTFRNKRQGVNHCVSMHVCFSDDDCFGGTCSGAFVGTCLCTGCVAEAQ
ncbi:unnamed protein product [Heligmosomoides polygyrus]|uniref:INVERT_DEFENSINS domain-containing protein n=1 Tax=Heligmosomoides polygyrus TaxID=6339 RepID=A0A183GJY9_HELPZ|nr:unnamed protein product [Heligmosomoides polygyrus]